MDCGGRNPPTAATGARGGVELDPSGKGCRFITVVAVGARTGLERKASGSHQGGEEEARKKKGRRTQAKQPLGKC